MCYTGICAEAQVACGSVKSFSGNEGDFNYSINIGTKGKNFNFAWDGYSFPDRFNVFLPNGTRIFTRMAGKPGNPSRSCTCSKCMSEETFANGNINLKRPPGVSSVKVVVNGYCPSRWTGSMRRMRTYQGTRGTADACDNASTRLICVAHRGRALSVWHTMHLMQCHPITTFWKPPHMQPTDPC